MNNYVCIFTRALACSSLKILQYVTIPFEFVLDTLVPFLGGKGEEDERSFVDFRYRHRRNSWPSSYIVCNMYVCAIHTVQARVAFLPPPPRPQPRALLSSSVLPDLRRFHVSPEINQKLTSNYDVGETDSQGSRVERVTSTRRNKHTERFRQKVNEMKVAVYSKTRENAYN